MDTKKIGAFLRSLRHEKGLTQEQLAEHFNISNRTISRWETGSNMPDISIITELADFYEIDIRELLDGERRLPDKAPEDTLQKVIDYTDTDKEQLANTVKKYSIAGLIALIIYVIFTKYNVSNLLPGSYHIEIISLGLVYAALTKSIAFATGRLEERMKQKKKLTIKKLVINALIVIGAILIISSFSATFLVKKG